MKPPRIDPWLIAAFLFWALFTAWTVYSFANGAAESIP